MSDIDMPLDVARLAARVFVAVCVTVALNFVGIVAIIVTNLVVLDQSEQNQRHIDCIVALAQPVIPERCQPVKQQLIDDGVIPPGFDRSTTTTQPTTED